MIIYGTFSPCKPRTKEQAILAGKGVLFIKDDEQNCWYDVATKLTEQKMAVVLIDSNNIVCGFNTDPWQMFPNGFGVVAVNKLPEYLAADGAWSFDGKEFVYSRDEAVADANRRKTTELTNTATLLQMYKDILVKEQLNPAALAAVEKLEAYRDLLIAIDVTLAPGIDWPDAPIL